MCHCERSVAIQMIVMFWIASSCLLAMTQSGNPAQSGDENKKRKPEGLLFFG